MAYIGRMFHVDSDDMKDNIETATSFKLCLRDVYNNMLNIVKTANEHAGSDLIHFIN